jgi:hypothetical protein
MTSAARLDVGLPRTVGTPTIESAVTAAVERKPWPWRNLCDIAREFALSQTRVLEVLHDFQLHPYHFLRIAYLFPVRSSSTEAILRMDKTIETLQASSFCITFHVQTKHVLHVKVCSPIVTSGHGLILMLFANLGINYASASAFGLES